jgi:hypothetical protein
MKVTKTQKYIETYEITYNKITSLFDQISPFQFQLFKRTYYYEFELILVLHVTKEKKLKYVVVS